MISEPVLDKFACSLFLALFFSFFSLLFSFICCNISPLVLVGRHHLIHISVLYQ